MLHLISSTQDTTVFTVKTVTDYSNCYGDINI